MLSEIDRRSCCGFKEKIPSKRTILLLVVLFVCPWLISLYLHFLLVFALYPILIGKGSVINTGPLFLISLLPSIILTGGAWLAKRVAFKGKPENTAKGDTSDTSNGRVSVQQLLQLLQSKAAPQSHAANHVASNASSIHRTQSWQKITSVWIKLYSIRNNYLLFIVVTDPCHKYANSSHKQCLVVNRSTVDRDIFAGKIFHL